MSLGSIKTAIELHYLDVLSEQAFRIHCTMCVYMFDHFPSSDPN